MPMQMPQIAPGYTPPMGQAAMAKARLMGYSPTAPRTSERRERDALKDRRKRERQTRKKNRKRSSAQIARQGCLAGYSASPGGSSPRGTTSPRDSRRSTRSCWRCL